MNPISYLLEFQVEGTDTQEFIMRYQSRFSIDSDKHWSRPHLPDGDLLLFLRLCLGRVFSNLLSVDRLRKEKSSGGPNDDDSDAGDDPLNEWSMYDPPPERSVYEPRSM